MAKVMMECPACHATVEAGGRFCPRCRSFLANVSLGRSASPARRLAATIVDWGIVIAAGEVTVGNVQVPSMVAGGAALVLLAYLAWWLLLLSDGASPGKRLFKLQVIDDTGHPASFFTMIIREWFAKVLSAAVLGFGFVWALFDDNHQAWHDKILGTYVIETDPVEIQPVRRTSKSPMPPAATTVGGVRRI